MVHLDWGWILLITLTFGGLPVRLVLTQIPKNAYLRLSPFSFAFQSIETVLGGAVTRRRAANPQLSWSETIPDPRPLGNRIHLHSRGHTYFTKEFLCPHILRFIVHMELGRLLPENFLPKLY